MRIRLYNCDDLQSSHALLHSSSLRVYLADWLIGETITQIKSTSITKILVFFSGKGRVNLEHPEENLSEQSGENPNSTWGQVWN